MCRYLATCVIAAFVYCTLLHNKVPMCFAFKEIHSVCVVLANLQKLILNLTYSSIYIILAAEINLHEDLLINRHSI